MTNILFFRDNIMQDLQMQLFQKKNFFLNFFFFFHFRNLDSILNIFRQKMTLIADFETPEIMVR